MSLRACFHQMGELGKGGPISFGWPWSLRKWAGAWSLLMAALLLISCSKLSSVTDSASAAKEAVRLYPELGVKDSTFNRAYLQSYREELQKNPSFFKRVDWPLELAHRTARQLGVLPATSEPQQVAYVPPETPAPTVQLSPTPTPIPWNPLERGAYDQRKMGTPGASPGWAHYYLVPNQQSQRQPTK
jgi:hypothetical protein